MKTNKKVCFAAGLLGVALAMPAFGANMIVNNVDAAGVGFNDPTPAVPVGGNFGTTVGQQRLVAYRRALELWGKTLRSSVTIVVQGSFAGLPCTAGGGVLAQAGALQMFANFPGAPLRNHWYGVALANALAAQDLTPGLPDPGPFAPPFNDDIIANFNGNVGTPDCIAGPGWYYGLDNNAGPGEIDFLDTFMHEVSHGLGFQEFVEDLTDGSTTLGLPDVYMANTLDLTNGRLWNTFTAAEIAASAVRTGKVVWAGPQVTANAPLVLGPREGVRLTGGVTKEIEFGTASFGPLPNATNFKGPIVVASDGVAPLGDGCEPITSNVAGKIAMIDRGLCTFVVKVKNAQNAGATGAIVANTLGRSAFGLGGADPTITIPSIGISNADGDAIKAAATPVNLEYFIDPSELAGTAQGFVRLYAPGVVEPGSSISHFDTVATPSLLMEPVITLDLQSSRNLDLTPSLMLDIGWGLETLKIGVCDTGVPSVLRTGQMLHANVDACAAGAKNQGQFVSCMNKVTNDAKARGLLSGAQHGAISSCTARGNP